LVVASRNTLKYDDVYNQSGPTNTTVYCGGIQSDLTGLLFLQYFISVKFAADRLIDDVVEYMMALSKEDRKLILFY